MTHTVDVIIRIVNATADIVDVIIRIINVTADIVNATTDIVDATTGKNNSPYWRERFGEGYFLLPPFRNDSGIKSDCYRMENKCLCHN
ncbi:hypothetical protein IQ259_08515 [Fortiea sp. LEGE XX443]|uniref:hypothetical protein n=1 Tax=Fortiea sp. LEGE XX443 TaxID=1828611 RepID=UPI00187F5660|nr:hypothetical protein [Fortiea sp. LEGE XX443]MBE9005080.1 hypothetical protein [Fortiea sp. LEGE XX443]